MAPASFDIDLVEASPAVFNGFGIMAVQLHRREISLKKARLTLEIMNLPDEQVRRQVMGALDRAKTKKQLARELEGIQDFIIGNSSEEGDDDMLEDL